MSKREIDKYCRMIIAYENYTIEESIFQILLDLSVKLSILPLTPQKLM